MWLALDIGGTKFAAGLFSTDGEAYAKDRIPVDHSLDGDGLFDSLVAMIRRLISEVAGNEYADVVEGVGIGCGGPMRWPVGEVSPLNIHAWRDFPLRNRIAELWPRKQVRLINDAMTMAIGEHWLGAGVGSRAMLGVVVSTGVGGGVVLDGRVLAGETGNAGHIGHIVVDPAGPLCVCGGRGCLEAIARGPAVVDWAVQQGWTPPTEKPTGPDLVEAARAGSEIPLASLTRAGQALGVAFSTAAHLLDLDRVVVGGGLATGAGDLIFGPAIETYERYARMDYVRRCKIVPASAGHDAGLVGAAALVTSDRYWPWNTQ